ncbi:MAG: lysophospholipase [Clostridia bacterium]|nr:lysophospholipase [Clostridia bacterium]
MKRTEYTYPSATGACTISAEKYFPEEGRPDTVLVIHHGMAEHRARYEPFIEFLTGHGIAVYMHDMASHGRSTGQGPTGWFGEKDGFRKLVEDYHTTVLWAVTENPGADVFVMGHSMGSFICRLYTAWYREDGIRGAIFMGTGGPNPAGSAGKMAASVIGKVKGKKHKSEFLNKVAFSSYNKAFEGRTPFDWLTRDQAIVDRYIEDPLCGYLFTVQGMHDLVEANVRCNTREWFEAVPKTLPVLLISGAMDPVGNYSKGIRAVEAGLKAAGHSNETVKLYENGRHEILNELNRDEVMQDILDWLTEQTKQTE